MSVNPSGQKMEQVVGAYFEACRLQDVNAIADCFAPGAVHYLPHLAPISGGDGIGNAIVGDLRSRGGQYFIDRIFTNEDRSVAAVEWSRTFQQSDRILRGFEICEFDRVSILIREIRGYSPAAPP